MTTIARATAIAAGLALTAAGPATQPQVPLPPATLATATGVQSAYAQIVQQRQLSQKAAAFSAVFPNTPVGQALTMVGVLVPYGLRPYNAAEFSILGRELNVLGASANAATTLSTLDAALPKLPQKYAAEKQFFIQFASRLPLPQSTVLAFLGHRLGESVPVAAGTTPDASYYSSTVALTAMLQLTQDTATVEAILVPALKAKTDVRERQALLAQYHLIAPARAAAIGPQVGVSTSP